MTRRGWTCVALISLLVGAAINATLVWWSHRPAEGEFTCFFLSEDARPRWFFGVSDEFARTQVFFYLPDPRTLYQWDTDRFDADLQLPAWSSLNNPSRDESAAYEEYFTEVGAGWPFVCVVSLYERSRPTEPDDERQQRILAWQMAANTVIITCMILFGFVVVRTPVLIRRLCRAKSGQCTTCGYDLSGTPSGTCSECGRTADSG